MLKSAGKRGAEAGKVTDDGGEWASNWAPYEPSHDAGAHDAGAHDAAQWSRLSGLGVGSDAVKLCLASGGGASAN